MNLSSSAPNPLLSIVIPTRNRSGFLRRCLEIHIPIALRHRLRIHVSDNASVDETAEVVAAAMALCPWITYQRNAEDIGPDKNFEGALKFVDSQYVWLLGDTYALTQAGVDEVLLEILAAEQGLDAIVVNVNDRVRDVSKYCYRDPVTLLGDLGWHMTVLSGLIYSRALIHGANFSRYYKTNFIQTGVIFEYLASKANSRVLWLPEVSVSGIKLPEIKKTSWESEALDIWFERWPAFIMSLPPIYPLSVKLRALRDHNQKARVFGFNLLYYFKEHLGASFKSLFRVKSYIRFAPPNISVLFKFILVLIVPKYVFDCLYRSLARSKD